MEPPNTVSVACQTEPNLIDILVEKTSFKKELNDVDLYQEYVRSVQCAQFWPLDKNPIRSIVPAMVKVDLPEQHLKNESLMFDLVQAISNDSKLVNLLAKYIHHIVPNVIISKRIDLIPLITCTIRVCRDTNEQERLVGLLFNLIKRPNEEQRRMILSGIIVVLQLSPHQSSSLLLPNLWDHVNDKFPERRILLAESCATLAHYVRPVMRTNLILSILIQLLKDKNAAVKSAACRSFACLLTIIMDRNDEVFDACLSATEDIIQDILQQTPVNYCEYRFELEQMRFCALETIFPLLLMWAVKLNRFKVELAEFYIAKAEKFFNDLLTSPNNLLSSSDTSLTAGNVSPTKAMAAAAIAKRRSVFFEGRHSSFSMSTNGTTTSATRSVASSGLFSSSSTNQRRQSAFVGSAQPITSDLNSNATTLTSQRAAAAYLKMLNYMVPFVFADSVNSCAWLSKSQLNLPTIVPESVESKSSSSQANAKLDYRYSNNNHVNKTISHDLNNNTVELNNERSTTSSGSDVASNDTYRSACSGSCNSEDGISLIINDSNINSDEQPKILHGRNTFEQSKIQQGIHLQLFDRPIEFSNKLLEPTLIIDESAIIAFHDQLEQDHMIESILWILDTFLPKYLNLLSHFSSEKCYTCIKGTSDVIQEFIVGSINSVRQLCLLFSKHLTKTRIRPLIKQFITDNHNSSMYSVYMASLTSFEPIEQSEFEEIVFYIRNYLSQDDLSRNDVEILAITIKVIATNKDHITSPSTRQKFLTYILDALVNYSNHILRAPTSEPSSSSNFAKSFLSIKRQQQTQNNSNNPSETSRKTWPVRKPSKLNNSDRQQTQAKEHMLLIFRHILTCLIDPTLRPTDWASILVTKFLPLIIMLANDSANVYICSYARLMCAQLVETFDTFLGNPQLSKQTADEMLPALVSLKNLTEQIKASNIGRQIEFLIQSLNDRFPNQPNSPP